MGNRTAMGMFFNENDCEFDLDWTLQPKNKFTVVMVHLQFIKEHKQMLDLLIRIHESKLTDMPDLMKELGEFVDEHTMSRA